MNCLIHRASPVNSPVSFLCSVCYTRIEQRFPGKADGMPPWVFLHIVKNGGTSVEHALNIPLKLQTVRSLRKTLTDEEWDGIYSFSFVRNPWDRVASLYHFHVKNEYHFRQRYEVKDVGGANFEEWLALVRDRQSGDIRSSVDVDGARARHWEFNDWVRLVYRDGLCEEFRYKKNWCYENQVDTLSHDGQIAVKFVGRFERINEDFQKICDVLGVKADLPHKNVSRRDKKDVRELYEDDTAELVGKCFAKDIQAFGYTFGEKTWR